MKKIAVVTCALLLIIACKKEATLFTEFSGKWEYEKFVGYPFSTTALPPGNGRFLILKRDGTFERRQHDSVLYIGRYFLNRNGTCNQTGGLIYFSTDENTYNEEAIRIEGATLHLGTPPCYADGGVTLYRRVEDR